MIVKGPVAIDGISLTVVDKDARSFAVSLVQYTQENTNLHTRKPGDRVNIETDIIARYVEQMLEDRRESGRRCERKRTARIERKPCNPNCHGSATRREARRAKGLATVEEAIEEYRNGRFVIIIDDEDRENEGDLTIPAQFATPEAINFMARYGRGLDLRADDAASASSSCTSR